MQQSVLIAAMRGPDGVDKHHKAKMLCRWLRRCIVISAFDKIALESPAHPGGGSYTGPSFKPERPDETIFWEDRMDQVVRDFLSGIDTLPHHFTLHFIHAAEIIGYHHSSGRIRLWWEKTYRRFCFDMHMHPESRDELDGRLNDCEATWRNDLSRFKP